MVIVSPRPGRLGVGSLRDRAGTAAAHGGASSASRAAACRGRWQAQSGGTRLRLRVAAGGRRRRDGRPDDHRARRALLDGEIVADQWPHLTCEELLAPLVLRPATMDVAGLNRLGVDVLAWWGRARVATTSRNRRVASPTARHRDVPTVPSRPSPQASAGVLCLRIAYGNVRGPPDPKIERASDAKIPCGIFASERVSVILVPGPRGPDSGPWSACGQRVVSGRGRPVKNVDGRERTSAVALELARRRWGQHDPLAARQSGRAARAHPRPPAHGAGRPSVPGRIVVDTPCGVRSLLSSGDLC